MSLCMFVWAPEDGVYMDHQCELSEGHDGPHRCCCGSEYEEEEPA